MVAQLQRSNRPLPSGGSVWTWSRTAGRSWRWTRVYHAGTRNPSGHSARSYGPLARFDPQRRGGAGRPQADPDGRTILYAGIDLETSLCEVFGETMEARICPRWRAAVLEPVTALCVFDLTKPGAAMQIGALPALGDGNEARELTQDWARAIYEDQPARRHVRGIRYRSGYNGGLSLALWDSNGTVRTLVRGDYPADHGLDSSQLIGRVSVALEQRRISLERIDSADCDACQSDPVP